MLTFKQSDDCCAAAWLCVCVLEPSHLLRLAARGAPVSSLSEATSRFVCLDPTDHLLAGESENTSHQFPAIGDLTRALKEVSRDFELNQGELDDGLEVGFAVVVDAPSMLSTFKPAVLDIWSPTTHAAYPLAARQRAYDLLIIRYALAHTYPGLPSEIWLGGIMPLVIQHRSRPNGSGERRCFPVQLCSPGRN